MQALLDLIAGRVENHPHLAVDRPTWANVGDVAHLRDRLMEIAVGFAVGPDGKEQVARRRIEDGVVELIRFRGRFWAWRSRGAKR